jgi:hypothetical protein
MIAGVHACVGAALGRLCGNKIAAFALGVVSHAVCDKIPHKDFPIQIEVPLLAVALGVIGTTNGMDSPEFLGAMGAVSPDVENGFAKLGLINETQMRFPTHQGPHSHGREIQSKLPQAVLAAACLAVIFWPKSK